MADDTTPVETATPTAPSNDTGTAATPPQVTSSADVEAAKKAAEQATLRANQLENENKRLKEAQDAATTKQLEEKEEFKTLYEKTQAQLNELTAAQESAARQTQLTEATNSVLKDYPAEVVDIAKTAGLALSDDSETAQTALKEKLDAIKSKVGGGTSVSGNNPSNPVQSTATREQLTTRGEDGISPLAWAGAKGDESVARKYVGSLNAVKEMRRLAGLSPKE
jgi:hypothetical protein